jgi:hypothetical protein
MPNRNHERHKARKELLAAILERSVSDAGFRSGLLSDPKRTITDAFGVRMPDHFRIRFIEKDADVDTLVVLPNRLDPTAELDVSALNAVSGGQDDGASIDSDEISFDEDSPW